MMSPWLSPRREEEEENQLFENTRPIGVGQNTLHDPYQDAVIHSKIVLDKGPILSDTPYAIDRIQFDRDPANNVQKLPKQKKHPSKEEGDDDDDHDENEEQQKLVGSSGRLGHKKNSHLQAKVSSLASTPSTSIMMMMMKTATTSTTEMTPSISHSNYMGPSSSSMYEYPREPARAVPPPLGSFQTPNGGHTRSSYRDRHDDEDDNHPIFLKNKENDSFYHDYSAQERNYPKVTDEEVAIGDDFTEVFLNEPHDNYLDDEYGPDDGTTEVITNKSRDIFMVWWGGPSDKSWRRDSSNSGSQRSSSEHSPIAVLQFKNYPQDVLRRSQKRKTIYAIICTILAAGVIIVICLYQLLTQSSGEKPSSSTVATTGADSMNNTSISFQTFPPSITPPATNIDGGHLARFTSRPSSTRSESPSLFTHTKSNATTPAADSNVTKPSRTAPHNSTSDSSPISGTIQRPDLTNSSTSPSRAPFPAPSTTALPTPATTRNSSSTSMLNLTSPDIFFINTTNSFTNMTKHPVCFENKQELFEAIQTFVEAQGSLDNLAAQVYGHPMNSWCVDQLTDMAGLFKDVPHFNYNISSWNTSRVVTMSEMFRGCSVFDQDLGRWDVSRVMSMDRMFVNAKMFKGRGLENWNVSLVTDMRAMFYNTFVLSANLSAWNVASVANMDSMFYYSKTFDSDLSGWSVQSVTRLDKMFLGTHQFSSDISAWAVHRVTSMNYMLQGAMKFDRDLCSWGPRLSGNVTAFDVLNVFAFSACNTTADPLFDVNPPGPFCYPCDPLSG